MAASDDELDAGSDLSDLSEAGSRAATPGNAVTPQTSPVPSSRTIAGPSTTTNEPPPPPPPPQAESIRTLRRRSSARIQGLQVDRTRSSASPVDEKLVDEGKVTEKGRRSSARWSYEQAPARSIFSDQQVEGKRERKRAERFGSQQVQQSNPRTAAKRRMSSAEGAENSERVRESQEVESGPDDVREKGRNDQPPEAKKFKVNLKVRRKSSSEEAKSRTETPDEVEIEESIQPTSRRRRSKASIKDEPDVSLPATMSESAQEKDGPSKEGVESEGEVKQRNYLHRLAGHKGKRKRSRESSGKKVAGGNVSDEYEEAEDWSAEEAELQMPSSDESDGEEELRHRKAKAQKRNATTKGKPKSTQLKDKKANKSTPVIIPVRDLAAEAASVSASSAMQAPAKTSPTAPSAPTSKAPVRPPGAPAKAAVRKAPSSNVLSSLLGFGAPSSRDGTPSRSSGQRPRPVAPGSSVSSPSARPIAGQPLQKRPTAEQSTGLNGASRTPNKDQGQAAPRSSSGAASVRQANPGLDGKHVTAEHMADLRERELKANANPRHLFDLLEGAELMMEFEDETRQRLSTDALLHKCKLYRPGRTEGMFKLIERIKEKEIK